MRHEVRDGYDSSQLANADTDQSIAGATAEPGAGTQPGAASESGFQSDRLSGDERTRMLSYTGE